MTGNVHPLCTRLLQSAAWLSGCVALAVVCLAAGPSPQAPHTSDQTILQINRGTFLNVDVSPDSQTLVFDLLGDLYLLPTQGGVATPLLVGRDWDQAPRFSPDGQNVAFVSDRSGIENVWVVSLRSREVKPITSLEEPVAGTPAWSPDGTQLLFGSRSTSSRLQLVGLDSREIRPLESYAKGALGDTLYSYSYVAATSGVMGRDGIAFFSELHVVHPRPGFHHGSRSLLVRFSAANGSRTVLTDLTRAHNESKPQLSASGRVLAYYRAHPDIAELRVRDLESGADKLLLELPGVDDPYRWGDRGDPMPTFAFTPKEDAIVVGAGGRILRVSISDGTQTEIPFHVSATLDIRPRAIPRRRLADTSRDIKAIRWPSLSRDRTTRAFSAIGSIWIQAPTDTSPRRLTTHRGFEHMPAVSRDGRQIAYVSYEPQSTKGRLAVATIDGEASRLVADGSGYLAPSWSPDGTKLAFVRQGQPSGPARDPRRAVFEYGWVDLATDKVTIAAVVPDGAFLPSPFSIRADFSEDGRHLLCTATPELLQTIVFSVALDGSSRRELAVGGRDVLGAVPSPDSRFVAFIGWNGDLWIINANRDTDPVAMHPDRASAALITMDPTTALAWHDAHTLLLANGGQINAFDPITRTSGSVAHIQLATPRRDGRRILALRNARVVTMAGDRGAGPIIDPGTIVIRDRRIEAVGAVAEAPIPEDATVIDATGLTVLPGFHDAHYHSIGQDAGFTPREDASAVAYGLTSGWDAISGYGDMGRAAEEMRAAGLLRGPRWFFAGRTIEHFVDQVRGPDDARMSVRRHAAMGVELLKDYDVLSRRDREWFADAARQEGLGITAHFEGLGQMLSRVLDGYTALEHARFSVPFEDDVLQLLGHTKTVLTPNVLIADGTSSLDDEPLRLYFEELQRQKPAHLSRAREHVGTRTYDSWRTPASTSLEHIRAFKVANAIAAVVAAGGKVAVSGHNAPAILTHVEMWLLWKGGLPPEEVIRAATRTGIEKVGYLDDLGSIEPGKIADLVVLESDPLVDILNTIDVRYTVIDGIVYDARTGKALPGMRP